MKVVYNSFNGRFADSPRVLYEAMVARGVGDSHVWLLDDRRTADFPPGVTTVPIATPQAQAALNAADVVIANCHLTFDPWRPKPGSHYLQTWHGTPLKRIHRSAVAHPDDAIMEELDEDIARWTHLIAPSRAGGELLRAAFGYTGPLIESGYPRNDLLSAADRDQRRARKRRELGIADGTTAVLYAPTFRDDDVDEVDVPLRLDAPALAARLGPDHHVLLRQHYYLGHRRAADTVPGVTDVFADPEIAELYLAADVLVTDYSSAMFDFAVTGKPIVLYTYDLEHYRDRLRGFTFDLEAEAPGPLVHDADELLEALLDLPARAAAYGERYAIFRDRYGHFEDGRATERVLRALGLWTPGTSSPSAPGDDPSGSMGGLIPGLIRSRPERSGPPRTPLAHRGGRLVSAEPFGTLIQPSPQAAAPPAIPKV